MVQGHNQYYESSHQHTFNDIENPHDSEGPQALVTFIMTLNLRFDYFFSPQPSSSSFFYPLKTRFFNCLVMIPCFLDTPRFCASHPRQYCALQRQRHFFVVLILLWNDQNAGASCFASQCPSVA
eukprot:GHVL01039308.1.p1 GENE.GHVL01039308.1~~GHVL01039308.1.p1  ORF type:complete len:124 (+),score=6.55 GHVL01039308.1:653-1024(+)